MATQSNKAFCVMEFHSTKFVISVQREFRRKFDKDPRTANWIRKLYRKFRDTGCICETKSSGRPSKCASPLSSDVCRATNGAHTELS
jgi:hypothetical protein